VARGTWDGGWYRGGSSRGYKFALHSALVLIHGRPLASEGPRAKRRNNFNNCWSRTFHIQRPELPIPRVSQCRGESKQNHKSNYNKGRTQRDRPIAPFMPYPPGPDLLSIVFCRKLLTVAMPDRLFWITERNKTRPSRPRHSARSQSRFGNRADPHKIKEGIKRHTQQAKPWGHVMNVAPTNSTVVTNCNSLLVPYPENAPIDSHQ
jgi:hypothetical protein